MNNGLDLIKGNKLVDQELELIKKQVNGLDQNWELLLKASLKKIALYQQDKQLECSAINSYIECDNPEYCVDKFLIFNKDYNALQVKSKASSHQLEWQKRYGLKKQYWFYDFGDHLLKLDIRNDKEYQLDNLSTNQVQVMREVIKAFYAVQNNNSEEKRRGFYLCGQSGVGKTYLTIAFANYLLKTFEQKKIKKTVVFVNSVNLVQMIKDGWLKKAGVNNNLYEKVKDCDVLLLDDFGTSKWSAWLRDEVFYNLLNARYIKNKWTFINSNLSMKEIKNKLIGLKSKDKVNLISTQKLINRLGYLTQEVEMRDKIVKK